MKIDEARGPEGELLYYYVRTDSGSSIASVFANNTPMEGGEPISLEQAKRYAELFASAPKLIEALNRAYYNLNANVPSAQSMAFNEWIACRDEIKSLLTFLMDNTTN